MAEKHVNYADLGLSKLNALRVIIVMVIALGYASTMPLGPLDGDGNPNSEVFSMLGYDPSWVGISLLFFYSGMLSLRSLWRHGSSRKYLESRFSRNIPILAVITLIIVALVYPIFGTPAPTFSENLLRLGQYFIGTVSCVWAGKPLPGLMDEAQYMCLVQGAVWTFTWGAAAHIATAFSHQLRLLDRRAFIALFAILSVLFYLIFVQLTVRDIAILPAGAEPGPRLAWPFLTGMAVYAYWDKLPKSISANLAISAAFFGTAILHKFGPFPWTGAIELFLISGWAWLGLTLLRLKPDQMRFLNDWAPIAVAIYLINWPTSQILLLMFPALSPWTLIALSLPISLVLAYFAHMLITRHTYHFADRRLLA
ncbi:MAG: hypothetical protein HKN36_07880 [Hellea sp.]|nr:hypothetical protein [Hellea sp.]